MSLDIQPVYLGKDINQGPGSHSLIEASRMKNLLIAATARSNLALKSGLCLHPAGWRSCDPAHDGQYSGHPPLRDVAFYNPTWPEALPLLGGYDPCGVVELLPFRQPLSAFVFGAEPHSHGWESPNRGVFLSRRTRG